MSDRMTAPVCSPLVLSRTAPLQCPATTPSTGRHHQEHLKAVYDKAQEALTAASSVVADIASGLYDLESCQTDVSARLCGRPSRVIGKKRKLSPSVYDYNDSCFFASSKADTPTQELLPASRSELRNHQLQAVRWLASLERCGAGGVLADELDQDRRAEVAGLMSHLASNPPDLLPLPVPVPMPSQAFAAQQQQQQQQQCQGAGRQTQQGQQQQAGFAGVGGPLSAAPHTANAVVLLAPGSSLAAWSEAISEHVDVTVQVYDGSPASTAALQTACAGCAPSPMLRPGTAATTRRTANGGAGPLTGSASSGSNSSAAGVFPPVLQPAPPLQLFRACTSAGSSKLLVVLAPLEHLPRDVAVLSQLPQRMMVVDLAARPGGGGRREAGGSGGGAAAASGDSSGSANRPFGPFSSGFAVGSDSGPRQPCPRAEGMDLESYPHLHLLTRMPAASRVLLSAGLSEPRGDGIWLLLQLLAPNVQQPLWQAVSELQQGLLASGDVGAQCRERVLGELRERLWGLLRPLTLHRRARDVDLGTMRSAATSLNLYDHFSAAKADGGA
ncbi:hypothetical protein Agub_g3496 [Astrephomene gubernaculifera]|uniref:Uncharacterized protein n=1 Tax=Astrephomene gubernaculifera TaxID=47775 RepID=A0AAD3DJ04_9CHLO|nr:hypothetical protein Agub_g3496 [Astrephomene gubernaculifera]